MIDPVSSMGEALMGASGSAAQAAANQTQQQSGQSNAALTLEEEATSLSIEAAQTSALTGGGTVPGLQVFAEREYIWGPGEGWGVAGTDELLAQFDRTRQRQTPTLQPRTKTIKHPQTQARVTAIDAAAAEPTPPRKSSPHASTFGTPANAGTSQAPT